MTDSRPGEALSSTALLPGAGFLDEVAGRMLAFLEEAARAGAAGTVSGSSRRDFSEALVLVPALPIVAELRQSLVRAAGGPLLLPRFDTLAHWIRSQPLTDWPTPLSGSERLLLLHEALRRRGWFDEGALWGIAGEMAALFDELTVASVGLPEDEAALAAQLERAYALRASVPLAFEARVVHELWRAFAAVGQADEALDYRLRLARLAPERPLLILLDAAPEESLDPAERDFLLRYGTVQPLAVFHPAPRESGRTPLQALLNAAWPEKPSGAPSRSGESGGAPFLPAPLHERAQQLAVALPESPLAGRLALVPAPGREQEAQAAVAQIAAWLGEGLRRIAVITQDRLTARRVRALLERQSILAVDETGWKLSTSRAAAAVDAILEISAAGAYYRDLVDLCKSPFVFGDCPEDSRKAAVFLLESAVRGASVRMGLTRIRRGVQNYRGGSADPSSAEAQALALKLLDRIEAAAALVQASPTTLGRWIDRLLGALDQLAALPLLARDAAGQVVLDVLRTRRAELEGSTAQFSFAAWRDWLNREMEAANFRDASITGPLVMTPLNAVCLRRFEAALLIGGDARQLAPAAGGAFFNQSVRRELGLPTQDVAERALRRDLELLLATVPRVCVTWQSEHDGEANLLAPEFDLLATVHRLAWQDDLHRAPLPALVEAQPAVSTAALRAGRPSPVAPSPLLPGRVSVSAYATLVDCPYRFFARYVLGLGEMDEVSEEMGKSDYGALVHRVLERFHERHALVSALAPEAALSALQACVEEVFAAAIEENFLALGWRLRWEKRLPAYLDWQRAQEAAGWRWQEAETRFSRSFTLPGGGAVELYGRIDRIDTMEEGDGACLLDYKTQTTKVIRDRLADDVQLPAYALLHGAAARAAYVSLDDERIETVAAGEVGTNGAKDSGDESDHVSAEESLALAAERQGARLTAVFDAMHGGAALSAHGASSICQWCEMGGLCRRKHVV